MSCNTGGSRGAIGGTNGGSQRADHGSPLLLAYEEKLGREVLTSHVDGFSTTTHDLLNDLLPKRNRPSGSMSSYGASTVQGEPEGPLGRLASVPAALALRPEGSFAPWPGGEQRIELAGRALEIADDEGDPERGDAFERRNHS